MHCHRGGRAGGREMVPRVHAARGLATCVAMRGTARDSGVSMLFLIQLMQVALAYDAVVLTWLVRRLVSSSSCYTS